MFCPECKAEYREGFTECSTCRVALVEFLPNVLDDEQPALPPTVCVWRGEDYDHGRRLVDALENVGLPAELVPEGDALEIRVPQRAAGAATEVIGEAFYSAGTAPADNAADGTPSRMCPLCLAEFQQQKRFCIHCLAPLAESTEDEMAVTIWESDSLGDAYLLNRAMRMSGIPFHLYGNDERSVPMLVIRRPLFERHFMLRVLPEDEAQAMKIVERLRLSSAIGLNAPEGQSGSGHSNGEVPTARWVSVWVGANGEELDALRDVFRENEIPVRVVGVEGTDGRKQLAVHTEDDARARSIIRQTLEGEIPPEWNAEEPQESDPT